MDNNTPPQHSHHSHHHSSHHSHSDAFQLSDWMAENLNAIAIILTIILALLSEMNWVSHLARIRIFEAAAFIYFVFVVTNWPSRIFRPKDLLVGPTPWIILTLLWCVILTVYPPSLKSGASNMLEPFAVFELARICLCVGIFIGARYLLKPNELRTIAIGMLGLGAIAAFYGIIAMGSKAGESYSGIFGNHEQAGSFVLLLFPIALSLAINPTQNKKISYAALACAIITGSALIVSQTRSAWAGVAAGLLPLVALSLIYSPIKITKSNRFLLIGTPVILLAGFIMLSTSDILSAKLTQRIGTFQKLPSGEIIADRLNRWKSACRMAYGKPATGWGLGAFPVIQIAWTGGGDTADKVIEHGFGHTNIAHNYWAQWAAETGIPGLIFYVGIIVSFLIYACKSLKFLDSDFRRSLMIGCVSAVTASAIDMIGAPSYNYPGVSTLPFLWMGVGMAALRYFNTKDAADEYAENSSNALVLITPLIVGILVSAFVLFIGSKHP